MCIHLYVCISFNHDYSIVVWGCQQYIDKDEQRDIAPYVGTYAYDITSGTHFSKHTL